MAKTYLSIATVSLALLVGIGLSGCHDTAKDQPAPSSDHDDHEGDRDTESGGEHTGPADFTSGVETLNGHYQTIKTAFDAGDPEQAHVPLHAVGHVLEALPELAKKTELSDDDTTAVGEAVEKMFDAYTVIDNALHKGEEADYASVATTLDENMAALNELAAKIDQ